MAVWFVFASSAVIRQTGALVTEFGSFMVSFLSYLQQHLDLPSGLAPAGVDKNFCRQWSLQK